MNLVRWLYLKSTGPAACRRYTSGSPHWRLVRARYYRAHARVCHWPGCHMRRQLCLHHLTYALLGWEPDRHLSSLCWFHHQQIHEPGGLYQQGYRAQQRFLTVR